MSEAMPGLGDSRLWNTLKYFHDSDGLVEAKRTQYGKTFMLKLLFGDLVMFTHPDAVRDLFALPGDHTASFAVEVLRPLLGDESLILLSGEAHDKMRRIVLPHFKRSRMKPFGGIITDLVLDHATRLKPGQPFHMLDHARDLIMEVMIRAVLGVMEPERVAVYTRALRLLDKRAAPGVFFLAGLRPYLLGLGPWRGFEAIHGEVSAMILEEIRHRRETSALGADILSSLLVLQDETGAALLSERALLDQMLTMIFAGYETTAVSLAWTFFWIHHQPKCLARVLEELDGLGANPSSEDIANLPYLDAVCKETLRRNPVVNMIAMKIVKPCRVGDLELTPGMTAGVSITQIHRLPEVYSEPLSYQPERFLERNFMPHEYIPFGGGKRRCVGAVLALYEMKLILGVMLSRYRFHLVGKGVPKSVLHGLLMAPKGKIPMVLDGPR